MTAFDPRIDAKFQSQWDAVRIAALDAGIDLAFSAELSGNRTTPLYVYERDHVLVRGADAGEVTLRNRSWERVDDDELPGIHRYRIGGDELVPDAVERVNREFRAGAVTPNHLVSICPVQLCPADEPAPLPVTASQVPYPPKRDGTGGQGVQVDVLDTGLSPGYEVHGWMAGIEEWHTCVSFGPTGAIKEYAGHGTFVTGVLRCAAPGTSVRSLSIFQYAGATTEYQLGRALLAALNRKPDIISLSAGGSTANGLPHIALEPFFTELTRPEIRTLLVAAAGNDGSDHRFYPAAYSADAGEAVVSVGALRYDGEGRACFSNHGDWVDVYAMGERHVNAFPVGLYSYVDPQRDDLTCRFYPKSRLYSACSCVTMPPQGAVVAFRGMARWSGTSFATPLVAGVIADYMSSKPEQDPRQAAQAVLGTARTIHDADGEVIKALDYT
ncbi:S8/S53 family peptidase [Lentzea sp. CC55]|uniref:S8 family peptidase n=1 Tax=Lentzea sp. CC55 TaxID=2884909 RepID=UPI001F44CA1B|nr:S8/S53 family peptidase [Lentzea sp. CC55]MCG8927429.1 S8/S53 family peptidase [Lentzea sp. CC55]